MLSSSVIWLILAIVLIVSEVLTVGLVCIWFAVGAVGGLLAAKLGFRLWVQLIVFAAVSALALFLIRPLASKRLQPGRTPTNADRLVGKTGQVIQNIDNAAGTGQVSVTSQVWTARSEYGVVIPAGTQVEVLRIEGVKVFVKTVS